VSDRRADDLVDGLGLAGLVVEPGAAADQGTADDGTRPEGARGPPIADREPVHGGADDGGAAAVGQVVVGGGGDEGADDGDAERRCGASPRQTAGPAPGLRGAALTTTGDGLRSLWCRRRQPAVTGFVSDLPEQIRREDIARPAADPPAYSGLADAWSGGRTAGASRAML
jgi:hypothetical protein